MNVVRTYCVGVPDLDRTGSTFMAVLVRAANAEAYAVYLGLVKFQTNHNDSNDAYVQERERHSQRIAANGMKATFGMAKGFFPDLVRAIYM